MNILQEYKKSKVEIALYKSTLRHNKYIGLEIYCIFLNHYNTKILKNLV